MLGEQLNFYLWFSILLPVPVIGQVQLEPMGQEVLVVQSIEISFSWGREQGRQSCLETKQDNQQMYSSIILQFLVF